MNLLKTIFRSYSSMFVSALILVSGCTLESPLELDLSDAVNKDVFNKMSPDETTFIKSVLFSDDLHTKGSIAWVEKNFREDLKVDKNVSIAANTILVVFFYPVGQLPQNNETGVIFTNVHQVEGANSTDEFTEWGSIARLSNEKIESPRLSCRLMFWFSPISQSTNAERLFEVVEEFELKNGRWHLLKMKKRFWK